MSSRGGAFSAEEVSYLKTLPAVADVTRKRITYTEEFKLDCVRRYSQGESPVKIFRDAGLEPSLVGYKRIECAIARWRRTMGVPTTKVSKGKGPAGPNPFAPPRVDPAFGSSAALNAQGETPSLGHADMRDMLIYQQVRRIDELEHQVRELSTRLEEAEGHRLDAPAPSRLPQA